MITGLVLSLMKQAVMGHFDKTQQNFQTVIKISMPMD
jgi:hypothetical protein